MSSSTPVAGDTPENWWSTSIIEMKPGMIRYRGYAVEELIGRVGFAEMVYLMTRGELPHLDKIASWVVAPAVLASHLSPSRLDFVL